MSVLSRLGRPCVCLPLHAHCLEQDRHWINESWITIVTPNHKNGKCRAICSNVILKSHYYDKPLPEGQKKNRTRESYLLQEQKCTDTDPYPDSQWAKSENLVQYISLNKNSISPSQLICLEAFVQLLFRDSSVRMDVMEEKDT